jgi:hypothetical protein
VLLCATQLSTAAPSLAWLFAAGLLAGVAQVPGSTDPAAREIFARAHAALVGTDASRDLRSFVFKGRLRAATESNDAVDGTVDIRIRLPDRYLRVDTVGGEERRSGFAGSVLLTRGGTIAAERARFARFMLGALAYVPADRKFQMRTTGESAFQDTEAVDIGGPGFSARLVFDASSHVPMRIVYFGERQVSIVVSFANRRTVGGLSLPFRVTTQTPDRVLETLMFDDILVNPDLQESEFRR